MDYSECAFFDRIQQALAGGANDTTGGNGTSTAPIVPVQTGGASIGETAGKLLVGMLVLGCMFQYIV